MQSRRNASEYLKRRIDSISAQQTLHKAEVIEIFRHCRRVLEQDGSKGQFPLLSLYADWLQHNKIDRHDAAFDMLERIGLQLEKTQHDDPGKLIDGVSHALGLKELRQEFIKMMTDKKTSSDLFTSHRLWNFIIGALFEELTENEITFPDDIQTNKKARGRKQFDRLLLLNLPRPAPQPFLPYTFWITDRSKEPGVPGRPPGLYWNMRLTPPTEQVNYAELNGHIQSTETMADFNRP